MNNYNLSTELNQKIVDGLMEGYHEYLEIRKEKAQTMRVSGAYAWVKGNHIDDKVANSCESYGVKSKLAKAGLTWQYLQFKHDDEKILFIVKNARYFDENQVDVGKDVKGKSKDVKMSYMEELMNINLDVDFDAVKTKGSSSSVQLELLEEFYLNEQDNIEITKIKSDFDRFYIITYGIDENQLISKISLFMPNPIDNKAYLIEDLSEYINSSHDVIIDDDLKDVLTNSVESDEEYTAFKFDIQINRGIEKDERVE